MAGNIQGQNLIDSGFLQDSDFNAENARAQRKTIVFLCISAPWRSLRSFTITKVSVPKGYPVVLAEARSSQRKKYIMEPLINSVRPELVEGCDF